MNDSTSTQLRAIEGEIERLTNIKPADMPFIAWAGANCDAAKAILTIAKELDYSCEQQGQKVEELEKALEAEEEENTRVLIATRNMAAEAIARFKAERDTLRVENATLKRRLDEAITGLQVAHERFDRLPAQADMEDALWCAISCEEIEHTLTRITEIDKL